MDRFYSYSLWKFVTRLAGQCPFRVCFSLQSFSHLLLRYKNYIYCLILRTINSTWLWLQTKLTDQRWDNEILRLEYCHEVVLEIRKKNKSIVRRTTRKMHMMPVFPWDMKIETQSPVYVVVFALLFIMTTFDQIIAIIFPRGFT